MHNCLDNPLTMTRAVHHLTVLVTLLLLAVCAEVGLMVVMEFRFSLEKSAELAGELQTFTYPMDKTVSAHS